MARGYGETLDGLDFSQFKYDPYLTVQKLINKLKEYPPDAYVFYEQVPAKSFVEGARVTREMVIKDDDLFRGDKAYFLRATGIVKYDNDHNVYISALWQ